jgi:hypothetical protein
MGQPVRSEGSPLIGTAALVPRIPASNSKPHSQLLGEARTHPCILASIDF